MGTRTNYVMVAEDDPGWVRFWTAYENRRSKKDARKAWAQLKPSPELVDRMVTALSWQVQDWARKADWYTPPLPATWLRDERWTDERPVTAQQKAISDAVADPMKAWLDRKVVG